MLNIGWIEWLGYAASIIVLASFLTNSIIKLRWISLIGSLMFGLYGFLINSIPTGILNTIIGLINIFYLVKIQTKKELFMLLKTQPNDQYLVHFLEFYKTEIKKYHPHFDLEDDKNDVSFYVLRDMTIAGLFLGKRVNKDSLLITLDFAIPEYRDFKSGSHIYLKQKKLFRELGYRQFLVYSYNSENTNYLKKMGFVEDTINEGLLSKEIS